VRATFRVGLIGLGHVGAAFAERLTGDPATVAQAAGRRVELGAIAVARPEGRQAPAPLVPVEKLIADKKLDLVVELVGGLEPARTYVEAALRAGREVVTANKQVIARFGPTLAQGGGLRFEAAVASAIPIVETLAEALAADRISAVVAILNGTTNVILQAMIQGRPYQEALREAQSRGLAEADPSADVDGHDAAAKLAILIMLAFRHRVDSESVQRTGIRGLDGATLRLARGQGQVVKLIGAAVLTPQGEIHADVRPRRVPQHDPLAQVDGVMNAIRIRAAFAGDLMLAGPGAGPQAAASAVLADVIRAARGLPPSAGARLAALARERETAITPLGPAQPYPQAG
jgi:homoserine dehydrogenase